MEEQCRRANMLLASLLATRLLYLLYGYQQGVPGTLLDYLASSRIVARQRYECSLQECHSEVYIMRVQVKYDNTCITVKKTHPPAKTE